MIYVFHKNIPFLTRMMQNWTKKFTTKMKMTKEFKKYKKDTINGYVYVEKLHNFKNYLWHII